MRKTTKNSSNTEYQSNEFVNFKMQYIVLFCMCHATSTSPPPPLPEHHQHDQHHTRHTHTSTANKQKTVWNTELLSNWLWTLALNENVLTSAKNGNKNIHHLSFNKIQLWGLRIGSKTPPDFISTPNTIQYYKLYKNISFSLVFITNSKITPYSE
jgi:hypothetical protein